MKAKLAIAAVLFAVAFYGWQAAQAITAASAAVKHAQVRS